MNRTICNNCAGSIIRSLGEHYTHLGLDFCSENCAIAFFDRASTDPESYPCGLAHDLGLEE
jgi:hypothetical protein